MWNVNESAHRCSDGSDGKRSGAANRKSNVRLGREGMSLQLPGVFDFVGDGDIAAAARQQIETHQRRCRRNLHKGHVRRRWSISSLFYRLVALALLSLPIVTQQVEQFPTQIAIVSAPFLASGTILGGIPFGPSIVEIKDADYQTVEINDGNFITVSLVGGTSGLTAGKTVLRFGLNAHDGVGNFSSLTIDKVCKACRLRFVYKSLQAYSDVFDVVPSAPYAIVTVDFPTNGISAVDLIPSPALLVVDKGGNSIPTVFSAKIFKAGGFGLLRQRQNTFTSVSSGGEVNTASFHNVFFDTPSTPSSHALGFNVTFPGGISLTSVETGLVVTGKVKYGEFQPGFVPTLNQTSSIPFPSQPVIVLRDWTDTQVKTTEAQIQITAKIVNGTAGAVLLGSTVIKSVGGVAEYTDLAIDKSGDGYSIEFSFISCAGQGDSCDSLSYICPSLSQFCSSLFTSTFLQSTPFNVDVGLAANLSIVVQASAGVAGEALNPASVVHILDLGGNMVKTTALMSVNLESNIRRAVLLSNPEHMMVTAIDGVATFTALSIDKTGTGFRLTFSSSNAAGQSLQSFSDPISITAAAIKGLSVEVQPGSALRGSPLSIQPRVAVLDRFNNLATEDALVKTVTAELVGEFQVGTLGGQVVMSLVGGFANFTDLSINNPAVRYKLRFLANGTWDTDNPKVGEGRRAIYPPMITESESFQILGVVSGLLVQQEPAQAYGGSAFLVQPKISLVDLNQQVVASASNAVRATVLSGPNGEAKLYPMPALQAAVFGVVLFTDLAIDLAGPNYKLQFEVLGLAESITTLSGAFSVMNGEPYALEVLTQPSDTIAAVPFEPPPSVKVVDAGGNKVPYNESLSLQAFHLQSTENFLITASAGIATFTGRINTAGTEYRLKFVLEHGSNSIQITSNVFVVSRGVIASLDIVVQPGHGIVGLPLTRTPVVLVRDAGGNVLVEYSHPITVSRAEGPSGSYPAGNVSVIPKNGQSVFQGLSVTGTARAYRLHFETTEPTLSGPRTITEVSDPFTVTFSPVELMVQNAPGPRDNPQIGGEHFDFFPHVAFLDSENQVVKAWARNVSLSLPNEDGMSGTLMLLAEEGVAVFTDLSIKRATFPNRHSISILGDGLSTILSIQVRVGSAASLSVFSQPRDAMSGQTFFTPIVLRFLDLGGNIVTEGTAKEDVTVQLEANKFGGHLEGSLTVTPVSGVVSFNSLKITGVGNGYSLFFTSVSFKVTSTPFDVHGSPVALGLVSFPAGAIAFSGVDIVGVARPYFQPIRIAVLDEAKNVISGGRTRPPFAKVEVVLLLDKAWVSNPDNEGTPPNTVKFDTSLGTTSAVVENGYALFDKLLLTAPAAVASMQGLRLKFTSNVTSDTLISPYFSTSLSEGFLTFKKQLDIAQSSGLTFLPMPTLNIRTGSVTGAIVRGSTLQVTVSLVNANGAVLMGTTTLNSSAGVYIFTDLSVSKATAPGQSYTLRFQVPGHLRNPIEYPDLTLLSRTFTVSVGPPASIALHSDLVPGTSGLPFFSQPCIALRDAGLNLVQVLSTVTASLIAEAQDRAMLIGEDIATAIGGLASFTDLGITNLTHGAPYQISFKSGPLEVRSILFSGKSGPPKTIRILTSPGKSFGGAPLQPPPSLFLTDAGGTPVTGNAEIKSFLDNNPGDLGVLSGGLARVNNGIANFTQISIDKACADYVLRFGSSTEFVLSPKFDVVVGPAKSLFLDVQPGPSVFGVNIIPAPRVVVLDAGRNWVTSGTKEIHARLSLPAVIGWRLRTGTKMAGTSTRKTSVGVAVFDDLTIDNAGSGFRIVFESIGLESFVTQPFDVSGPPAVMLVNLDPAWLASGTQASAGAPFRYQPRVQIADFDGDVVRYYDVPHGVTASVASGQQLAGDPVADIIRGVAIFTDLELQTAADVAKVSFTYGGPLLTASIQSPSISVKAGTPQALRIVRQPSSSSRGMKLGLQPILEILDVFQNSVTWYSGTLTAKLLLGDENKQAYLGGTSTLPFTVSTGIASYTDLNILLAEQMLHLRFQTGGLRVDSDTFNIKQGPPNLMILGNHPIGGVSTVGNGILQPQPIIHVVDSGYGVVDSFSGIGRCATRDCNVTVTLICCPLNFLGMYAGSGSLLGATSQTAQNGKVYFTDLTIDAPGDYTLRFKVEAIDGISGEITYDVANIPVQDFTSMKILNQPGQALLGEPMRGQPRLQMTSSSNQRVNASYHVVNVSLTAGVGCVGLQGRTSVAAMQGVVQFTDLFLQQFSGPPTCRFNFTTSDPPSYVLSEFFAMTYGPSSLVLPTEPDGASAGSDFSTQPILEFRDKGNFLMDSESGQTVTAELLQGDFDTLCGDATCNTLLKGRTSILNINGVSSFTDLRVDKVHAPGYILFFRMGNFAIYSQKFTVSPGAADSLRVVTQPINCQISVPMPISPQIELLDAGMNRVDSSDQVTAQVYPTTFTGITLTNQLANAVAGLATFISITLSGDAALGISLEFVSGGLSTVSNTFLAHRPTRTLVLQNPMPSHLTAGETFLPEQRVGLRDDFDFPAIADSSSTIKVSLINKITGVQTELTESIVASDGLATFQTLKASAAGEKYVFKYFLNADNSVYCESNFFSVVASSPKQMFVVSQPSHTSAAEVFVPSPSVRMEDEFNNQITSSPGYFVNACVDNSEQCSETTLLLGGTSLPLDSETIVFSNLAVHGPPSAGYRLLFYMNLSGNQKITALSNTFNIMIGKPLLNIEHQPKYAKQSQAFIMQPTISIADAAGNRFSGSSGSINYMQVTATLSHASVDDAKLSDSVGDCPCVARFIDGVVVFDSLKIDRAGRDFKVQFSMSDLNVESVFSQSIDVSGDILYMEILGVPSTIAYQTAFDVSVSLRDANGLLVSENVLMLNLVDEEDNFLQDTLLGASSASALMGTVTFQNLKIRHVGGSYRLKFNASGFTEHSSPFTVIARNGTNLAIVNLPSRLLAVTPISPAPVIQVHDEFGFVSRFSGDLTVSVVDISNSSVQVPITVAADQGLASLSSMVITKTSVGQGFRVKIEGTLLGRPVVVYSDRFRVDAGRLASLKCVVQPSDGIVNEPLHQQPVVNAVDSGDNLLSYFSRQVTIVLNTSEAQSALQGTNVVLAENGVATFTDLAITETGNALEFSISTLESCGVTSKSIKFKVTKKASYLALTVVPPIPNGGSLLDPQPQVTVFDERGIPVSASMQKVTMSLCMKPEGSLAILHGNTSLQAVKGIVSFTDVSIDRVGTYQICYTSEGMIVNQTLEVRRGPARYIRMLKEPTVVTAGKSWTSLVSYGTNPIFRVEDAGRNPFLSASNQGLNVNHLRIEVINSGQRSKQQMMRCGSCVAYGKAEPCFELEPYDSVAKNKQFTSDMTPECYLKNPGRNMQIKFSILENNVLLDSVITQPFDVVTGWCNSLKVILHPSGVIAGRVFRRPPIVEMRDPGDNTITWVRNVIQVSLESDITDATLSGCREANGDTPNTNVDGTATFFGCVINCNPELSDSCLGQDRFRLQFEMSSCDGKDLTKTTGNTRYFTNYFTVSREANKIQLESGALPATMAAGLLPAQPRIEFWVAPCNNDQNSKCLVESTSTGLAVSVQIYGASNGAALLGTTSALVVNGVAEFTDLTINEASTSLTPPTYNISFHVPGFSSVWHLMTVTVGSISALKITQQPTLSAPGVPFQAEVSLVDAGGNVVADANEKLYVLMALDSSFSVRSGVTLKTSALSLSQQTSSGVAQWSGLTVNKAPVIYSFTFSATKSDGTNLEVKSERISVVFGAVAEIQIEDHPQDVLAGGTLSAIVAQLYDAGGNKIRTNTLSDVTAELASGGGTMLAKDATINSEGVATFNDLSIAYTSGESQHVIKIYQGAIMAWTNPFYVHLAASKLVLSTNPSQLGLAGTALAEQPVIEIRDAQNQRAYAVNVLVSVALVEDGATLKGTTTATSSKGSVAFTDLSISGSGSFTLSFTASTLTAVVSPTVEITAGNVAQLQVVSNYQPGEVGTNVAGYSLPVQPRVQLFDSGGLVPVPVPDAKVHVRISEYPAGTNTSMLTVLFGTAQALPDSVTGVASFTNLAINAFGTYKLEFYIGSISVISNSFTIQPGPIAQLMFKTQPSPSFFDEVLFQQPVIYLLDKGSNFVVGTPWIHMTLGKGRSTGSTLTGCDSAHAEKDSGVVTMSGCKITGTNSGDHTLLVSSVLSGTDVLSSTFEFNRQMDTKLVLESVPFTVCLQTDRMVMKTAASGAIALHAFVVQPEVHVIDEQGTLIQLRGASVTVSLEHPHESLLLGNKIASLAGGVAQFLDLRIDVAGVYTVNFTLSAGDVIVSTQQHVTVAPSVPSKLLAQNWPTVLASSNLIRSGTSPPKVLIMDAVGNSVTDPVQVSVTSDCADKGGIPCFQGTKTVAASAGASEFNDLTLHRAGNVTLMLSHAGLSIAVEMQVSAGEPARIVILQQPAASFLVDAIITPSLKIQVEDAYGNIVIQYNQTASVALHSYPTEEARLSGHALCTFVHGVCVFNKDLSISVSGFGFRVVFKSGVLESVSDNFNVHTLPSKMSVEVFPTAGMGGSILNPNPQIRLFDDAGLPVLSPPFTVIAKIEARTATLTGNTSVISQDGIAQFTDLAVDKMGRHTFGFECNNGLKTLSLIAPVLEVVPGEPRYISVEVQPGGFATGGTVIPIQPQIFLRDAGGNLAEASRQITVNVKMPSAASIEGTIVVDTGSDYGAPLLTYSAGTFVFTDLRVDIVGTHILTFSSPGLVSAHSTAFDVSVGPAAKLGLLTQPGDVNVGQIFGNQPTVQIQDMGGNHVRELEFIVTAAINIHSVRDGMLGSLELRGSPIMTSVLGWANYTKLQIDVAGLFCDLRFSSPGLQSVISNTFMITAISPASSCVSDINYLSDCGSSVTKSRFLMIEEQPTNVVNGRVFATPPLVRIRDSDGVIINEVGSVFASVISSTGAKLHDGREEIVGGVAVFDNMYIDTVGADYSIQFRFKHLIATSVSFNVITGNSSSIRFSSTLPTEWVVNKPLPTVVVDLVDHGNFLVTHQDNTCPQMSVAVKNGPSQKLSGTTSVSLTAGQASFAGLLIEISGAYSLTFTCDSAAFPSLDTGKLVLLSYAQPSVLQILTHPGPAVPNFDGVNPANRFSYRFDVHPKVRLVDEYGNLVHGFRGHFKASKKSGYGFTEGSFGSGRDITLPAVWGMVEFDRLPFVVDFEGMKQEVVKLEFGSTCCSLLSSSQVVSTDDVVLSAQPTLVEISVPDAVQSGEPFQLNVTVKTTDVLLHSYLGTVSIALYNAADNSISHSITGVQVVHGVSGSRLFPGLVISKPGSYFIRAYATRPHLYLSMIQADSETFNVAIGPGRGLSFLTHTSGCYGGVPCTIQPVLQILDASGNTVAVGGVVVSAAVVGMSNTAGNGCCTNAQQDCPVHNVPCPILGGSQTAASDAAGKVIFTDVSVSTAGTVQVVYTALGNSIYETVYVKVGTATRAKIVLPPSGFVAGLAFSRQPIVIASDFGGNWVSLASDTVDAKVTLLGCTPGDLGCGSFGNNFTKNEQGISRFTDLGTTYAGSIRLEFKLRSVSTCLPAVSCWSSTEVMQVAPGIPSQLVIVSTKTQHFCSGGMTPPWILEIRDASDNRIVSGGPYSLSVTSTPAGEVGGVTNVHSIAGQANFSQLNIMKSCYFYSSEADAFDFCYTLTFRLDGITVTSNPFTVIAGPATDLEFNIQPAQTSIGSTPGYPSVRVVDISGNPVIPVPASVPVSCGTVNNWPGVSANAELKFDGYDLRVEDVSPLISYEKTSALSLLLGQGESYISKTSVVFNGLNLNWRIPQCYFPTSCPNSDADFRNFRIRVSSRFGSLVSDSAPFSVDVAHPVDFNVYQTNFSAVVLRWNAPFFGPAPLAYSLRYRSLNRPGAQWTTIKGIQTNIYTFSELDRHEIMEFEICSQSVFDQDLCAVRGPALLKAGPVQTVNFAEVAYATETSVFLSWQVPPHGLPPPAYQITIQEMPDGWETVLLSNVAGLNVTIPDLSPNKTYVFGVYSKAAGGDYYSPLGAKTEPVLPTAAASNVFVSCPLNPEGRQVCTGSDVIITWTKPTSVLYQPRYYKVISRQYLDNMTVSFISEQLFNTSDGQMSATVTGLALGRYTRLTLLSESVNKNNLTRFAPTANIYITPKASPSPPEEISLKMVNNRDVVVKWTLPKDSGDGTPHGTAIKSYLTSYKEENAASWIEQEWVGKYNLTRTFTGLDMEKAYIFRVAAENDFLLGQKCSDICSELPRIHLMGSHIQSTFVLGNIPYWDSMYAPVKQDPPPLFNLFVGTLFTFSLKAMSTAAAERISIQTTGLDDCGATLTSVVVGNPATATLTWWPAIQHLDKTFWICFTAKDDRGAYSEERCLQAYVVRPNPTFLAPIDHTQRDPVVRSSFTATVGCLLEFDVKAHDLTSGQSITAAIASSHGYNCYLKEHRTIIFSQYERKTTEGLPEHAVLEAGAVKYANPSTRAFSWRPVRGQDAFDYHICFTVEDSLGTSNTASPAYDGSFCVHVAVKRCRMCLMPGESLFSVAKVYGTEWLNIWSGNSALLRPGEVPSYSEIQLGPLYKALPHETISKIAKRMSTDADKILSWNPDLYAAFQGKTDVIIEVEQDICVLPSTCTQ